MSDPRYTIIIEPAEEGGYVVHVPALNGIATQGETWDEAIFMVRDAIEGYIEVLADHGLPIPKDTPVLSVTTSEKTFTYNDYDV